MNRKLPTVIEKKLGRQKAAGQAFEDENKIEIDPRQRAKDYLDTMVHEWVHLEHPDWPERKVAAYSKRLTKFLWKHDVRLIKK